MIFRTAITLTWIGWLATTSFTWAAKPSEAAKPGAGAITVPGKSVARALDTGRNVEWHLAEKKSHTAILREDDNFSLIHPGDNWRGIDPKRLHRIGSVAFERTDKQLFCVVAPYSLAALGRLEPSVDDFSTMIDSFFSEQGFQDELTRGATIIDGRNFGRLTVTYRPLFVGLPLHYDNLLTVNKGFGWQIMVWGKPEDTAEIESEVVRIAKGFKIIDESKKSKTLMPSPISDQDRAQLGYSTNLKNTQWGRWLRGGSINSLVDFAAEREGGGMLVLPLRLSDEEMPADLDAIAHGLLMTLGLDYPDGGIFKTHPWGKEGIEVETTFTRGDGHVVNWLLRVAKHRAVAHLVAGYVVRDPQMLDMGDLRDALDAVTLSEPNNRFATPDMTGQQIKDKAQILNAIGLHYFHSDRPQDAARYFILAFKQREDSPVFLSNAQNMLERMGKFKEAYELLKTYSGKFPGDKGMQAHQLLLAASQGGDVEKYAAEFIKLLESGYNDQDTVDAWVGIAVRFNKHKTAIRIAEIQKNKTPTVIAKMTHGAAVLASGDTNKGLALFEKLVAEHPTSDLAALRLAEYYNEFGKFGKAADMAMNMINTGRDSSRARIIYAISCGRRALYREAKQSLDVAQQMAPTDAGIKNLLLQVASMLGEGVSAETQRIIQPVPIPDEVKAALAAAPKIDQLDPEDRPGVMELRSDAYFFKKGQRQRHTMRRRMKLLTKEGAEQMGSLQFNYDPVWQHLYVNFLEVTDPEGKTIPQQSNAASYVRDTDTGDVASHVKTLYVPVSGLRPGCILEYAITIEDNDADDSQRFYFQRHGFGTTWPVGADIVYVTGDVSEVKSMVGQHPDIKTITTGDTLAWYYLKPPVAKEIPEPYQAPMEDYAPIVWLGDAKSTSWKEVAEDYLHLIQDRLKPDSTLSALAKRLTESSKDEHEKIAILTRYAQKEINYKAIEFGLRARRPNPAIETLNHRYGDCKDHALLLQQLLTGAGIKSHLTLLNTGFKTKEEMPSLDQFNHMILYVPALGPSGYVDITGKYGDASALPGPYFRTKLLVLDPENPGLMQPPTPPADSARTESRRTITVDERGDAHVDESVTVHGYLAEGWHAMFASATQNNQLRSMQGYLDRQVPVQLEDFQFENLAAVDEPARMKMSYTLRKAVRIEDSGKRSLALPAVWERAHLPVEFVKSRRTPFQTLMPIIFDSDVTFKSPKALEPSVVNEFKRNFSSAYCSWEMKPELSADGKELKLTFHCTAKPDSHPAAEYEAFHDAWDTAVRIWDNQVRWAE